MQLEHIQPLEPRRFFDAGLLDNQFNTTGAAVTDFKGVGSFGTEDNGVYTVRLRSNQVGDMEGNLTAGRTLGTIRVVIPIAAPITANAMFSAKPISRTWKGTSRC